MSHDMLSLLIDRIEEHLDSYALDHIECLWHGGEPSLMPLSFWEQAEQSFGRFDTARVTRNIQTNLLGAQMVSYRWLVNHGYRISSSLDGDHHVHELGRGSSAEEYGQLLHRIQAVKGLQGSLGVVCVVSALNVSQPRAQLDLYESLGLNVRFNKVHARGWKHHIGYREYFTFLIGIAREWLDRQDSRISVDPIEGDVAALFGNSPHVCYRLDCAGTFLVVDPDGSVYPCNRFAGLPEWRYGNLREGTLAELWAKAPVYFSRMRESLQNCSGCRWFRVCGGGCKWERYQNTEAEQEEFCHSVSGYFEVLFDIMQAKVSSTRRTYDDGDNALGGRDIQSFMQAWDDREHAINRVASGAREGNTGQINLTGSPDASLGPIVSRWQPGFIDSVEPGVQALVSELVWQCGLMTYSSCEGHLTATSGPSRLTLRRVSILPRTEEEGEVAFRVLARCAQKANERAHVCNVTVRVKAGVLMADGQRWDNLTVLFGLREGCGPSIYFSDLERVYKAFVQEISTCAEFANACGTL